MSTDIVEMHSCFGLEAVCWTCSHLGVTAAVDFQQWITLSIPRSEQRGLQAFGGSYGQQGKLERYQSHQHSVARRGSQQHNRGEICYCLYLPTWLMSDSISETPLNICGMRPLWVCVTPFTEAPQESLQVTH